MKDIKELLNSSFMTPLTCNFSAGIGVSKPQFGTFTLGLTGCKLTFIRDKTIWDALGVAEYYGVPKGKNMKLEYGLTLQIMIDKDILKFVHWNCDFLAFKNYQKPIDVSLKNQIGLKISRLFKGNIQTRLNYNESVSRNLQLENTITAGFSVKW